MGLTIVWTPSGGDPVTLCDLSDGWWAAFEHWAVEGLEQEDRLAFSESVFRQMRGNVSGQVVFKVGHSHDTPDAAAAWFQSIAALLASSAQSGSGKLVITIGATVWSYTGATFKRVEPTKFNGREWWLRYTFGVGAMDAPVTDPTGE
jgi:hypothetical protein